MIDQDDDDVSVALESDNAKRQLELSDVRSVMSTKEGRRFMWRLLNNYSGILKLSFAQQQGDMAFNEGMRNIGIIQLRNIDEACRPLYWLMLREASEVEGMSVIQIDEG